jgi:integrase
MARKDEYKATEYPGIKQRIKDGKYLVVIDLGRQPRLDKKTGLMVQKQCKTQKVFDTLKEAKAYQGENNKAKSRQKVSKVAGKVTFRQAIADYDAKYSKEWGASYTAQKKNQERRMLAYFGDTDVRDIDTLAIEQFFEWCRTPNEVYTTALGNNTIEKYKTHLTDLWKFMKKGKKYGVTENVVADADVGDIEKFEATILTTEQVKYLLWYVTHCEKDYSVFCLLGIPALAGMRRGELCGLRWKDIDFENGLIDVAQQRMQAGSNTVVKVPKMGDDNGKTRFERRQRYAALPNILAALLQKVKEQQTALLDSEPSPEDYVYRTKMNMVRGELPRPGKVSKRFVELQERCNKVRKIQGLEALPIIRLHDLRHTFISLCINGGVNHLQVSSNCGHRNEDRHLSTTIKVYWHDDQDRTEIREFINNTFKDVDISTPDLTESIFDNLITE